MSFRNHYQYLITMFYSVISLSGLWRRVHKQLKTNYFWLSHEHIQFIVLCQWYGYAIIQFAVLIVLVQLLWWFNQDTVVIASFSLFVLRFVWFVAIVHQSYSVFSWYKTISNTISDALYHLPAFAYRYSATILLFFITSLKMLTNWKNISVFAILALVFGLSSVSAQVNLSLDAVVINGWSGLYQNTSPSATLLIKNNWSSIANVSSPIASGFISCLVNSNLVFSSNPITTLVINPNTTLQFSIALSTLTTQTIGSWQTLQCSLGTYPGWTISSASASTSFSVQEKPIGRFDLTLDRVKEPIADKLDGAVAELWVWGIKSWVYKLIDTLMVPAATLVGIFFALIALYKILFEPDKEKLKSIRWLILYAVIGILLMLSAKFIWSVLYNDILYTGEIGVWQFNAVDLVAKVYDLVLYPFLKIFYYIGMGALFIVLLLRVFSFVNESADEVRKKSVNIIIATALWLLVIIGSKQLVEWVYGKESQIRNGSAVTVTDIGSSFLSDANIPIIYTIIQRVMGLAGFAVLAIIIFQTFKMLTDPTNEENLSGIRKTILYVVLGMLVIGAGYLIVNVVMLN